MSMSIYCGTYAKYNNGSIAGKWMDLEDYTDKEEFIAACNKLHEDEEDPELMFQDWEGIPSSMVGECWVSPDLWEVMKESDLEAVKAYLSIFNKWDSEDFQDRFRGRFDSWEQMAEELLEETGTLESIPENLRYYFDFEKYARDMELGGDFAEESGYFFWNH